VNEFKKTFSYVVLGKQGTLEPFFLKTKFSKELTPLYDLEPTMGGAQPIPEIPSSIAPMIPA
jgi:hypothetical protein